MPMRIVSDYRDRDVDTEEKKEKPAARIDQELMCCEICGRPLSPAEIPWEEGGELLHCRECRMEDESCGCSD